MWTSDKSHFVSDNVSKNEQSVVSVMRGARTQSGLFLTDSWMTTMDTHRVTGTVENQVTFER